MQRFLDEFTVSCASFVAALVGVLMLSVQVQAENIVFPVGSGVINVKDAPYNAKGDGVTDDTAAIQAALTAGRSNQAGRIVYFPNGTYLVSDTLVMTVYDAANTSCSHRTFTVQGQSRDGVIIKLVDNAAGFNAAAPKPVINSFRFVTTPPPCTPTAPAGQNFTNSAFSTNIQNITVDTGAGNTKATGINYIANNQGSLRDVLIRTGDPGRAGFSGLDFALARIAGPAFIKNLTVEGFDYGIRALEAQYSTVYENITLRNQNRAGIYNQAHVLSIRRLTSENSVPAVRQVGATAPAENPEPGGYGNSVTGFTKGFITLIDSELNGGANNAPAIDIQDGFLFARNITTSGYANVIDDQGTVVPGTIVKEYRTGNRTYKAFEDSPDRSLNLEIRDTPTVAVDDLSNEGLRCLPANVPCAMGTWASVKDFGATQNDRVDDDTDEIQAALNSGASTIFFPNSATNEGNSRYNVTATLTVGGNVRSVLGNSCSITVSGLPAPAASLLSGGAVFKFVDGSQPTRLIENFRHHVSAGSQHFVEQASEQTLVMRNMLIRRGYAYRNTGFGDVYIEDFHNLLNGTDNRGPSFVFKNQRVWARQINPEVGLPEILNDGATVWILGLKTEQQSTLVETRNNGKTEILGGISLISRTGQTAVSPLPAFINNNSSVSIVHTEYRQNPTRGFFPNVISETRGEETRTLTFADLPSRPAAFPSPTPTTLPTPYTTEAYAVTLYTGYPKLAPMINLADQTVVYNGAAQGATGSVVGVDGENLGAPTFTYNGSPDAPVNAGTYTVVASFAGNADYAPAATVTATLVIKRAAPIVNVAGGTFVYNGQPRPATGSVVGVNNEQLGAPTFSYNGSPEVPVNAGAYAVTASFNGSDNYLPATNTAETIRINKATAALNLTAASYTYDGAPKAATVTTTPAGLSGVTVLYNNSPQLPVDAGTYQVTAALNNPNYEAPAATATLVINRAATAFANLAQPSIIFGTTSTVLSGRIAAGALVPPGNALITLNNATRTATINPDGTFAATFAVGDLAADNSPYTVSYVFAGSANFAATTGTSQLTVGYNVRALYDATKAHKSGSTVPIKIQLLRADGVNVSSSATIVTAIDVVRTDSNATFPATSPGNSNPDGTFRFDAESSGYAFNLKTTGLGAGVYNLRFRVGGNPIVYTAEFRIR